MPLDGQTLFEIQGLVLGRESVLQLAHADVHRQGGLTQGGESFTSDIGQRRRQLTGDS